MTDLWQGNGALAETITDPQNGALYSMAGMERPDRGRDELEGWMNGREEGGDCKSYSNLSLSE